MRFLPRLVRPFAVSAVLFISIPAHAVDGVFEINQARAMAGGISTDDAPGFPVQITGPGHFRLTSNLVVASGSAITTSMENVVIDLNGFSIIGPTKCTAGTTTCTPESGTGTGVRALAGSSDLTVRNGVITGMSLGVFCSVANSCVVENVTVTHTKTNAIYVGPNSTVKNCNVQFNGGDGIRADTSSIIDNNIVSLNGGRGLLVLDDGVMVTSNVFYRNKITEIGMGSYKTTIGGNSFNPVTAGNWFDNNSKMTEISPNVCIDGSKPYTNCTGL